MGLQWNVVVVVDAKWNRQKNFFMKTEISQAPESKIHQEDDKIIPD